MNPSFALRRAYLANALDALINYKREGYSTATRPDTLLEREVASLPKPETKQENDAPKTDFTPEFVYSLRRESQPNRPVESFGDDDATETPQHPPTKNGKIMKQADHRTDELTFPEKRDIYLFSNCVFALTLSIARTMPPNSKKEMAETCCLYRFASQLQLAATTGYTHPHLLEFAGEVGAILKYYEGRQKTIDLRIAFEPIREVVDFDIEEWIRNGKGTNEEESRVAEEERRMWNER